MSVAGSDAAAGKLAHGLAVELRQAPATEQEQAWRELIAAEPRCGMAYSSLINFLADAGRNGEIESQVEQWNREQPQSCVARSANGLQCLIANDPAGAETELREALRLHPGRSTAVWAAFKMFARSGRWADLVTILRKARASRPDAEFIQVLLADALAQSSDEQGGRDLRDAFAALPEEDEMVEIALLQAALTVGSMELAGRVLQRLGPQVETSESVRHALESFKLAFPETARGRTNAPIVRPRSFTPAGLHAELERRLTPEERKLVVNPLEITPEVTAEARRL